MESIERRVSNENVDLKFEKCVVFLLLNIVASTHKWHNESKDWLTGWIYIYFGCWSEPVIGRWWAWHCISYADYNSTHIIFYITAKAKTERNSNECCCRFDFNAHKKFIWKKEIFCWEQKKISWKSERKCVRRSKACKSIFIYSGQNAKIKAIVFIVSEANSSVEKWLISIKSTNRSPVVCFVNKLIASNYLMPLIN